jgi:hypothetical protein
MQMQTDYIETGPRSAQERMQREKMAAANQECGEIRGIPSPSSFGYDYTQANVAQGTTRTFTLKEEAEKLFMEHRQSADKAERAIVFLSENPAFDEFVRLVRAGVIQF